MTSLKHIRELQRLRAETQAHTNFRLRTLSNHRSHSPFQPESPPIKFIRTSSSSLIDKEKSLRKSLARSTKKIYTQLSAQLSSIQESICQLQNRRKKAAKTGKKMKREAAEEQPRKKLYEEMLEQIQSIKRENRAYEQERERQKASQIKRQQAEERVRAEKQAKAQKQAREQRAKMERKEKLQSAIQEKTLFYGMQYIGGKAFKVKIKLSPTQYSLLGKNNEEKICLEMTHDEYLRLHDSQLNGNPCNIFQYLRLQKGRLRVSLSEGRTGSLRGYIGRL